jgi:RNA polymerase sigma-70 factor (ECF subfamily)
MNALENTAKSPTSQRANDVLVSAARAGDQQAIRLLIERHYPAVVRFIGGLGGDHATALDLTQEAFLLVFQRLDQLTNDDAFVPWLYRIARNQWRSQLRYQRLRHTFSLDWIQERFPDDLPSCETQLIEDYADCELVRRALSALNPKCREVLLLRHFAGCTAQEVALVLDISSSAAQRRLNRAEQVFRLRYLELEVTADVSVAPAV